MKRTGVRAAKGTALVASIFASLCATASCDGAIDGRLQLASRDNGPGTVGGSGGTGFGGAAGATIGGTGALSGGDTPVDPVAGDPKPGGPGGGGGGSDMIDEPPPLCDGEPTDEPTTGSALTFDGVDDYVTMGRAPSLGLETFTIEAWFMRTGPGRSTTSGVYGVDGIPLVSKARGESDGDQRDCNYFLGIRSDGVLAADFEDMENGANHPVSGTTLIEDDVWYHGAATFDGASWKLYVNGELEGTVATSATPRWDTAQHFGIGSGIDSLGVAGGFFAGIIDEVRVWDRARSEAEIKAGMTGPIMSGPGLVGRWGFEEGAGATSDDSVGASPGMLEGPSWTIAGSPFDATASPQPSAIAPAEGAVVPGSVTLSASVADDDSPAHDVTFYLRKVTEAPDFTIATLPDTQYYSLDYPETYVRQTEWLMANRERLNIVYVAHMGDMVDYAAHLEQWERADRAMRILEEPQPDLPFGLPYCPTVGNHDQTPLNNPDGTENFNKYFGSDRFDGRDYYGGHFGSDNDNNYGFFSASGMDFIHISLEFDENPDADVIEWADQTIKAHPTRRAIVTTHYMINPGNPGSFGTQGRAIYEGLKDNPNLFLLLGGHMHGEGRRSDEFEGRTVMSILQDYQMRVNGGDGWLRYFVFSPANNRVEAFTYSPTLDAFERDDDSEFSFSYTMASDDAEEFMPVSAASRVKTGDVATVSVMGLEPGSKYQWYVSAEDCSGAGVTEVQTFQTAP